MERSLAIIAPALALAACAPEESRRQVVRLDLDEIAVATAARDRAPGFETLGPGGPAVSPAETSQARPGIDR